MRITSCLTFVLALVATGAAAGQSKTIPGELVTVTAKVEAIDHGSRTLTIRRDGALESIIVPAEVKKFPEIKVGDTITARYYDSVTIRKKPAGEPAVDSSALHETAGASAKPTGTAAHQRTITATIAEIDMKVPSVTFKGPNNWSYSSRVADRDALKQVKVGDRVDITWTEAITLSVTASR